MTEFLQRTQEFDMIKLPKNKLTRNVRIVRMFARALGTIFALLIFYMIVAHAVTGDLPGEDDLGLRQILLFAALFFAWLGLIIGWKSEGLGGLLNLGGVLVFFFISTQVSQGNLAFNIFIPALALPGFCYLYVWERMRGE